MSPFERWSVWVTSVLTGLTGAGYFWTKYLVESTDPFAVVNHPLQTWFLKAHILVSPFLLLALGMILVRHVWRHYVRGMTWGRKSGALTALFLLPMVLTGYLIQSVTAVGWLRALAIAHIVTGFLYLAGLVAHQVAIHFMLPPPEKRRLYSLRRKRQPVGRREEEPEPAGADGGRQRGEDRPVRRTPEQAAPETPGASREQNLRRRERRART